MFCMKPVYYALGIYSYLPWPTFHHLLNYVLMQKRTEQQKDILEFYPKFWNRENDSHSKEKRKEAIDSYLVLFYVTRGGRRHTGGLNSISKPLDILIYQV